MVKYSPTNNLKSACSVSRLEPTLTTDNTETTAVEITGSPTPEIAVSEVAVPEVAAPEVAVSEVPAPKALVNPGALENCTAKCGELTFHVLDISFIRLVVDGRVLDQMPQAPEVGEVLNFDFQLDRNRFTIGAVFRGKGANWARFSFEKMVPSAQAHLRAFLSPRKIGESIFKDWETGEHFHYHGLNECELWLSVKGPVLFTYLDPCDASSHFIVRVLDDKRAPDVGKVARQHYIEMAHFESELPLITLADRETYTKISECRDIITNFRPVTQKEYLLKQRLLKVMSDYLYSTSQRYQNSASMRNSGLPLR